MIKLNLVLLKTITKKKQLCSLLILNGLNGFQGDEKENSEHESFGK